MDSVLREDGSVTVEAGPPRHDSTSQGGRERVSADGSLAGRVLIRREALVPSLAPALVLSV